MPRAALILSAGLSLGAALFAAGSAPVAGAPPDTGVTTTTIAPAATTTTTTVAGAAVPTTSVPATTVPRGGATSGSVAKPEAADGWSVQRMLTVTALGIVALAAAGYAVGRIRSTPPVHPDLVRQPE